MYVCVLFCFVCFCCLCSKRKREKECKLVGREVGMILEGRDKEKHNQTYHFVVVVFKDVLNLPRDIYQEWCSFNSKRESLGILPESAMFPPLATP